MWTVVVAGRGCRETGSRGGRRTPGQTLSEEGSSWSGCWPRRSERRAPAPAAAQVPSATVRDGAEANGSASGVNPGPDISWRPRSRVGDRRGREGRSVRGRPQSASCCRWRPGCDPYREPRGCWGAQTTAPRSGDAAAPHPPCRGSMTSSAAWLSNRAVATRVMSRPSSPYGSAEDAWPPARALPRDDGTCRPTRRRPSHQCTRR